MSSYCFDIDGTICTQGEYLYAKPYPHIVSIINQLYNKGYKIILYTARGTTTGIDWQDLTKKQLEQWGVKYHDLIFGKPEADYYIDDRGINVSQILELISTDKCSR